MTAHAVECPGLSRGRFNYDGIAPCDGRLVCAPFSASSVLVYSDDGTGARADPGRGTRARAGTRTGARAAAGGPPGTTPVGRRGSPGTRTTASGALGSARAARETGGSPIP